MEENKISIATWNEYVQNFNLISSNTVWYIRLVSVCLMAVGAVLVLYVSCSGFYDVVKSYVRKKWYD